MTPYERLKDNVLNTEFAQTVDNGFWGMTRMGTAPWHALAHMSDTLCGRYGMSGELTQTGLVLWIATSRAKRPACIIVSRDAGQNASMSAGLVRRTGHALIQVFEGDADDADMAEQRETTPYWIKTQDRVLFH